jgi:hypothetical protein
MQAAPRPEGRIATQAGRLHGRDTWGWSRDQTNARKCNERKSKIGWRRTGRPPWREFSETIVVQENVNGRTTQTSPSMNPNLIGYFPKRVRNLNAGLERAGADSAAAASLPMEEIASVSDCVSPGPDGWRDANRHNFYEFFDTPALAWSLVPPQSQGEFQLFAYRLYPVQFVEGQQQEWQLWPELTVAPMPESFVRLGWDAATGGDGLALGCSPLSCNGKAGTVGLPPVNRYCLASSERDGFELARLFSIEQPEPGPYCVVEVWRLAPGTDVSNLLTKT